ncbi:MAG: NAD(P)H-dependent glycerol-3-phosphate dehydrogenase [Planctomycetota bacterium]
MTTQSTNNTDSTPEPALDTVAVLGVGQMGLVCAQILATAPATLGRTAPEVRVWGHSPEEVGRLAQTRTSDRLPGFHLDESVRICLSAEVALAGADLAVSAIPVQHTREAWTGLKPRVPAGAGVVSVAKGIEHPGLLRPTQIIAEVLADNPDAAPRPLGVLSGPTIAPELARCLPATMIAASDQPEFAETLQSLFTARWLRVYTNPDVLGVELAGATKNVIAIAAGILDGLQAGANAKSALLARGLAEIARLGAAMGASPDTFFGIAGVGDLATTCFSPEGRNRSCGEALGKGQSLEDYLNATPFVVEGVETARAVRELAGRFKVEMPIADAVYSVLFGGTDPIQAITRLMSRDPKEERVR